MGFLQNLEHLAAGVGHTVAGDAQSVGHVANIALQDIPLISRDIQKTMSGQVSPGVDLAHAREFNGDPYGKGYFANPFHDNGISLYDNSPVHPSPQVVDQINHATGFTPQVNQPPPVQQNPSYQRTMNDMLMPMMQHKFQPIQPAQLRPYLGANGQPEPTTQQVAPNSVLNHPQVSQPSFIQQLMSLLHQNPSQFQVRPSVNPVQLDSPYNDQTAGGALQGYNQNDLSNGIQGGVVNQGYIPLQGSRFNNNQR